MATGETQTRQAYQMHSRRLTASTVASGDSSFMLTPSHTDGAGSSSKASSVSGVPVVNPSATGRMHPEVYHIPLPLTSAEAALDQTALNMAASVVSSARGSASMPVGSFNNSGSGGQGSVSGGNSGGQGSVMHSFKFPPGGPAAPSMNGTISSMISSNGTLGHNGTTATGSSQVTSAALIAALQHSSATAGIMQQQGMPYSSHLSASSTPQSSVSAGKGANWSGNGVLPSASNAPISVANSQRSATMWSEDPYPPPGAQYNAYPTPISAASHHQPGYHTMLYQSSSSILPSNYSTATVMPTSNGAMGSVSSSTSGANASLLSSSLQQHGYGLNGAGPLHQTLSLFPPSSLQSTTYTQNGPLSSQAGPAVAQQLPVVLPPPEFVSEPSGVLKCKIHCGVMTDPVIVRCGHSFCKPCIFKEVEETGCCPVDSCRMTLVNTDIRPNLALAEQIEDLMVYCIHRHCELGSEGCSKVIKYKDRVEHEAVCDYAPMRCPNCPSTEPALLRKDLDDHVRNCKFQSCPHKNRGCSYVGLAGEVDGHLLTCRYELLREFYEHRDVQTRELMRVVDERAAEMNLVRGLLEKLVLRVESLEKRLMDSGSVGVAGGSDIRDQVGYLMEGFKQTTSKIHEISNEVTTITTKLGSSEKGQQKYKCTGTYLGHTGPIWSLAFSKDLLVSGSSDDTVKVWDCRKSKCVQTLTGHEGIVHAVAISDDRLFTGSSDCTIRVWSMESFELLKAFQAGEHTVCTLATTQQYLFSGTLKIVRVWDKDRLDHFKDLTGHNHWVRALAVAEDRLYSGSYNNIRVWSLRTFECVHTIQCQGGSVYSIAVDLSTSLLVCGLYENIIEVFDAHTFSHKKTLRGHSGTVYAVAIADNHRLFSGSYDTTIRVWSLETFEMIQLLTRHSSSVAAVVQANGVVFSGAADNEIKVWA